MVRPTLAASAAAATLAFTAGAQATIIPGRSVGGVHLGDSQAQVQARLGQPASQKVATVEIVGRQLSYRYPALTVSFDGAGDDARVLGVLVTGRSQRTSRRVGVGSTRRQVARRVPGAHCQSTAGYAHCWVGSFTPGSIVTDFRLRGGHVADIALGRVVD